MELTENQKIDELLRKSKHILVALPDKPTLDQVAAALSLQNFLLAIGKQASVCGNTGSVPELSFLPGFKAIKELPDLQHNLVVTLKTSNAKLEEISYQTEGEAVHIYLKAKEGSFSPDDVSARPDRLPVDLLAVIGASNLESLENFFQKASDSLLKLPKVNIDKEVANEYFGSVNYIDNTAISLTEVVYNLFKKNGALNLNPDIATCVLTGIIASTHSFQDARTNPHVFSLSAELISAGARQQDIIQALFKTKDFSLLRLWGRSLARMKNIPNTKVMYTLLPKEDFEKTESVPEQTSKVIEEFLENIADFDCVCLAAEINNDSQLISLAFHPKMDWHAVLQKLHIPINFEQRQFSNYRIISAKIESNNLSDTENLILAAFS